ncbi:unnamed protein product [Linum tenue]|uniref:Serine protease inhibitor n=3 Tax=Linum tenue TaxID=586396 RepID=A0AAV0PH51_9ROSI|nr:unnamed protein product [Linum tenue]
MLTFLFIFSEGATSERPEAAMILQVTEKGAVGDGNVCPRSTAAPTSCPINCFRADPVCGVDGMTYWCGCADAACHGTNVAKLGACEVGSGGSASLPGQALLLVHIVWLFLLGFSLLFGLF